MKLKAIIIAVILFGSIQCYAQKTRTLNNKSAVLAKTYYLAQVTFKPLEHSTLLMICNLKFISTGKQEEFDVEVKIALLKAQIPETMIPNISDIICQKVSKYKYNNFQFTTF